ncbi:MAG: hypothetical protein KIT31_02040 [Deltaproteobacteria bacterium]|nr:hypothetical protein [Deltaproteobacteria bacterium]
MHFLRFGAFLVVGVVLAACSFKAEDGKLTPDAPPSDIPPSVQFQFKQSSTNESDQILKVRIVLSRVSRIEATVNYTVTGGTASASGEDQDFAITGGNSGTLTFAPGETMKDLDVVLTQDLVEEPDETIDLALEPGTNVTLGENATHRVTINQNLLPRVQFAAATSSANEETPTKFQILMNAASPIDVVVEYVVVGTAAATNSTENPLDHTLGTSGSVTIPAGMLSVDLDPGIVDDAFDEPDETIDITINPVAGAKAGEIAQRVHTILNTDAPPAVAFGAATSSVSEGAGTALIPVTITPQSGKTVTVDFAAANTGSASAGDFSLVGTKLTFTPGVTTQMITVQLTPDTTDEDDETAVIVLANPVNATLGTPASHTLTILDDDPPPSINFTQAASSAGEGAGTRSIGVTLSAVSGKTITYSITVGGTALAGAGNDFTIAQTTFTIPPGQLTSAVDVTILQDTIDEDNETVILALSTATNATIGDNDVHTLTIIDDDPPPTVRFNPATPNQSVAEGNSGTTTFEYQVILSVRSGKTVTVPVTVTGNANAADFSIPTGDIPVVFQPGQAVKSIRVVVNGDTNFESDNTVIMTLGSATNATNTADNQVRIHTILNDD